MQKSADAVSEVIGVMILLTITIIMVGVAAMFAGSMMNSDDKAITSTIVFVSVSPEGEGMKITFENTAGGAFPLSQLRIVITNMTGNSRESATYQNEHVGSFSGNGNIMAGGQFYVNASNLKIPQGGRFSYQIFDAKHETPITSGMADKI